MQNNKTITAIAGGLLVAAAVVGWLFFGGDKPVKIEPGNGVSGQINASLKNSVLQREQDGKLLWKFTVDEVVNDRQKNMAYLKGIKGQIFRTDGGVVNIKADKGLCEINKNDFSLEGKVNAVLSTGGSIDADKITWRQKQELILAKGNVKLVKDEWTATADEAETTSAFKKLKLKGNAKVKKGGN